MLGNQAAIAVRHLVEVPNGWKAKVCEVATKFPEVLLTQHLRLARIGTPSHIEHFTVFAIYSPSAGRNSAE